MSVVSPTARAVQVPPVSRVELFRLLSDEGRLQLLALCAEEELAVGELAEILREGQPQVSRKVAALRQAGLLESRRDGTRTLLRASAPADTVVAEALAEGRRLCLKDGSLARVAGVVAGREASGQRLFEAVPPEAASQEGLPSAAHLAHLAALAPLLPNRALAVDAGTGEGLLLDVLAPLFERVIAVDRSRAQLARCAARVAARGYAHVSLFPGSYDDVSLYERVSAAGGADLVYAARTLHHASRPAAALQAFARLLRRGGHLVVLDYLPHSDESLRREGGDVWQGFGADELPPLFTAAGLQPLAHFPVPPALHREGPDRHLDWHAWVARKSAAQPLS
ncbi:MAG: metalloregulator ArsR/SmtB family transcription factor [Deltaproteobacteria bacterium]|nr:metalloregulator ArsR/SmtB family transcription factor [Deltaproteobacteria bacterium]